ncbi:MAG: murein biosynthesis integral membrane protein MurJ [Paracoccaceae bacterium]|nr:murein biosynthesis integral membrane protein MurJ [Paracoccaceae bacterium]
MSKIRMGRAFATVGLWTLASRILGFVRDVMIAGFLGAGPVAEAFLVAFSLPNMFRRFFAEGAFNMAFVPMFSKRVQAGEGAQDFANTAFMGLGTVLVIFTLVAQFFMPWLVWAMASGFLADERFEMATQFGRIAFPYILFISLAALLSGVLNATGRFMAAAAAPVLLNVFFIAALYLAYVADWPIGFTLAWTVPFAGIGQLALLWVAAARAGYPISLRRPKITPELKRLALIAAPAALAGGVMQVNLLVGRQVASFYDGAIAWLNYADRLYQLPLGVVGIAIGVVLLPDLSRRLAASDTEGGQLALSRAGEVALALALPSAVALIVIPLPLVTVLFERGAFGADDSAATALAVMVYALGLPAFVMQKVMQPLFFAREDTKRPFRYALVAMIVNAGIAIGLMPWIGFMAAALATSLSAWVMVILLWIGSRGMGQAARFDKRFKTRLWKISAAAVIMGATLFGMTLVLGPMLGTAGLRYIALAILVIGGSIVYFVVGGWIGAIKFGELKSSLRR